MFENHLVSMSTLAAALAAVFAVVYRRKTIDRVKYGLVLFAVLLGAAILMGWLMRAASG